MSEQQAGQKAFTPSFALLSIGALAALVVLIGLGYWQVERLHWKEALIERVNSKIAAPPVPLLSLLPVDPARPLTPDALEYRPVRVTGRFRHKAELFYYATLKGEAGFHVYTPLEIEGAEPKIILVNRGFIPADKKDPATRPQTIPSGTVAITGLLRWPDQKKPNRFMPDNDQKANIYFWRDLSAMIAQTQAEPANVLPYFLYADKTAADVLPVGGVTIIDFPNSHLGYAITWFGLALTLIGVYLALLVSRLKPQKGR